MGESRGEQAGSVLVAVVMFDSSNVVEKIFDISHRYLYQYFSECFPRSPMRRRLFVDVLVSRRLRFRAFLVDPTVETSHTVGPTARRDGGAARARAARPLSRERCGRRRVVRGPPRVTRRPRHAHDDFTSVALVAARSADSATGRRRVAPRRGRRVVATRPERASARFSCCSWWPDLPLLRHVSPPPRPHRQGEASVGGAVARRSRNPDQRWLDPARAENAFALLSPLPSASPSTDRTCAGLSPPPKPPRAPSRPRPAPRKRARQRQHGRRVDCRGRRRQRRKSSWIISAAGSGRFLARCVLLAARRARARRRRRSQPMVTRIIGRTTRRSRRRVSLVAPMARRREPATMIAVNHGQHRDREGEGRRAASDPRRGIALGRGGDRPRGRSAPPFVVPVDDLITG